MNRRDFLKFSLAAASLAAVSPSALAKGKKKVKENTRLSSQGFVTEPAREIPIIASTDVLVVGGGPAGVAAAISAAREGVEVFLIEKYGYLGGLWTGGLVLPVLATNGAGKDGGWTKAVQGICTEICERIAAIGMCTNPNNNKSPKVDPEATKYILDEMIQEAGVKLLYFTTAQDVVMSGDRIDSVILDCKSGRVAIRCKQVIDCSGDGDIFYRTGDPFTEMKYQIGTMHLLANTDRVDTSAPGYKKQKIGSKTPINGLNLMHMVGERDQDGLDVYNLTRLQLKYRKEVWEKTEKLKQQPGYEKIFLAKSAEQLGVRVTRVLDALHRVTLDDSMRWTTYSDVIGMSGACDTHIVFNGQKVKVKERPVWQIPYRSLVPKNTKNLLTAGRCFSFDKGIAYDAREIGTCFVTGQAAGIAAAMALKGRCAVSEVEIENLQKILKQNKVRLEM